MGDSEKEVIDKVKSYLKHIRDIRKYRDELLFEIDDFFITSVNLSSPVLENARKEKTKVLADRISKNDQLLKIVDIIDNIIEEYLIKILFFGAKERKILKCYVFSEGYTNMINNLNDKYYISESNYIRLLPKICLKLSNYIDYNNPPEIEEIIKNHLWYDKK